MEKDAKKLAGEIGGKVAAKYIRRLKTLLSAEGKTLLSAIGSKGGASAEKAAEGIKNGDINSLKELMGLIKNTEEGRLLAKKIMEITRK